MPNKDDDARRLADAHYAVEPGITEIFRYTGEPTTDPAKEEPIKLLEVNSNTIAVGIMPLGFRAAPDLGIHFPSVILEVTPEEFERIQSRELPLPKGWAVGEIMPRPVMDGAR